MRRDGCLSREDEAKAWLPERIRAFFVNRSTKHRRGGSGSRLCHKGNRDISFGTSSCFFLVSRRRWAMKVLAVHPGPLMYTKIYVRLEPLGLELVAQAGRQGGHQVQLIDLQ